ncbi:helix-turn-helix transcriptional regulator [Microbacterium sp. NEAU-LLC]|uniref:Helix-turn-helix transcriptional regulator n=1 Tax=Microbacterium helvum TaxID=2773713 RepID=A0ABR8NSN9_9MICO|nr:LuxR family transcriptional regulator [Microbacterium helvum]MBD3943184.1 helix-turn-helix transcriptional regulator [Microbacterium helvum]
MALSWPLTGRAEELDYIELSCGRGGSGIMLSGRAGVGKTRLARDTAARAADRRVLTRFAVASATAQGIPLGAFGPWVDAGAVDVEQRLAALRDRLLDGRPASQVLVVVDDAHRLDPASAALVAQLAQTRAARLVITIRSGEPAPDAVTAIWAEGLLPRLEVQPLAADEITVLVEAALDGQLEAAASARLFQLSQGNVLYLRQMVEGELDAGRLAPMHGVWRWGGMPRLSPSLTELVEQRIDSQPDTVRDVLDVLALAEPLELPVLESLTEAAAVEAAETRGMVVLDRATPRPSVRSAHPLFAEVRRAALGTLRARRLRARIVTALAPLDPAAEDPADTMKRAVLSLDAEMPPEPELLTRGAEIASTTSDSDIIARIARTAVDAGGGVRARRVLAFHVAWTQTDPNAADAELAALEAAADTDDERAFAATHRASYLAWVVARLDAGAAVVAAAHSSGIRNPVLDATGAMIASARVDPDAEKIGRRVLDDPDAGHEATAVASVALMHVLAAEGRTAEAAEIVARGAHAASQAAEFASYGMSLAVSYVFGLGLAGRVAEAVELGDSWRSRLLGHEPGSLFGSCIAGFAQMSAGQLDDAMRLLREARAGLERFGDMGGWRYITLVMLTRATAYAGDRSAAAQVAADLDQHVYAALPIFDPELLVSRATFAAVQGESTRARALAIQAADVAGARGHRAEEVWGLQHAVVFGEAGLAHRAAALVPGFDGPRAAAVAALAAASDAADGAALLDAAACFEGFGDLVGAADAAALAAVAFDAGGRIGSAAEARVRMERAAARGGGIQTPAMARARAPLPLTGREREIAELAAHGATNHEISERLFVSVRTVEGHLYRINQKLGITHRDELGRFLG